MDEIDRFLREDLGRLGDLTSRAVFGTARPRARARVYARRPIVVAGAVHGADVFRRLGARVLKSVRDGSRLGAGRPILEVEGAVPDLLAAERLALNLLAHLSGIATKTRAIVDRVHRANPRCEVAATRKTLPGLRALEKDAVEAGGGVRHRDGLYDGILVKDNHISAVGFERAVDRALANPWSRPVEVEVTSAAQAAFAAKRGVAWVLIDNLGPLAGRRVAEAARKANRNVRIEASGGLDESNVARYAAFADRVSLGAITHSAPAADVTMDLVPKH